MDCHLKFKESRYAFHWLSLLDTVRGTDEASIAHMLLLLDVFADLIGTSLGWFGFRNQNNSLNSYENIAL